MSRFENPEVQDYIDEQTKKLIFLSDFGKELRIILIEAYFKGREDLYKEIEIQSLALKGVKK